MRETLFNWLGQTLEGQRTWDAYAGSGALSLEAVSRGAHDVSVGDGRPELHRSLRVDSADVTITIRRDSPQLV